MLAAVAQLIGFAHVAVDQAVGRDGLAAAFAGLAASVVTGVLALHLHHLAALFKLAA